MYKAKAPDYGSHPSWHVFEFLPLQLISPQSLHLLWQLLAFRLPGHVMRAHFGQVRCLQSFLAGFDFWMWVTTCCHARKSSVLWSVVALWAVDVICELVMVGWVHIGSQGQAPRWWMQDLCQPFHVVTGILVGQWMWDFEVETAQGGVPWDQWSGTAGAFVMQWGSCGTFKRSFETLDEIETTSFK